jgi:hypothetical protein
MNRKELFDREFRFSLEHEDKLNAVVFTDLLPTFMRRATRREDMTESTDAVFEGVGKFRISQRVRRVSNTGERRDFTVRWSVACGRATERDKLGQSDLYVYGWVEGEKLVEYILVDIRLFISAGLIERPRSIMRVHSDGNQFGCWPIETLQDGGCLIGGRSKIGQPISHRWTSSQEFLATRKQREANR